METSVVIFLWMIVLLMVGMSIVLLSGRGAYLIAGYNTSSKEKKDKYDEKKLSRVMGLGLSVITLTIAVSLTVGFEFTSVITEFIVIGIIIGSCLFMIIAGNIFCRK